MVVADQLLPQLSPTPAVVADAPGIVHLPLLIGPPATPTPIPMRFALLVLLALPLAWAVPAAICTGTGAELLVNGDFELPNINTGSWGLYATLPGWTHEGAHNIELEDNAVTAAKSGGQLVELDSDGNYVLVQNVATVVGKSYVLSFWYTPRPGVSNNNLAAMINDVSQFSVGPISGAGGPNWQNGKVQFTATSVSTKISFTDNGPQDSLGMFLDLVSLKECGCNCDETTFTGSDCTDAPKTASTNGKCVCAKFAESQSQCSPSSGSVPCPSR